VPTMMASRLFPRLRLILAGGTAALSLGLLAPPAARGQDTAPVTVYDSPLAWQLLQQAFDQARENPSEAARLAQRLLDDFGDRLVPAERVGAKAEASVDEGAFEGVAERVERFLRTYPSVLARYRQMEEAEAVRLRAQGGARAVAHSRSLTKAGLDANLELAEEELHAARFGEALARLRRLEGHPDLAANDASADAGRLYWFLRGACAAFLDDPIEREQAESRLKAFGIPMDAPELASIERFAAMDPVELPVPRSPLSFGEMPASDEGDWQPVWIEELEATPFSRIFVGGPGAFNRLPLPDRIDRARFDGSYLVVAPTVIGDAILISDGGSVRALDRLSHRTIWRRELDVARIDGDFNQVSDLALVATGEGAAVLFPGYGFVNERGTVARVLCVSLRDGRTRWEVPLASLRGADFEDLFPIGQPVIADGSVYCLARKVTTRLETVDYLLSFSLADGSLRFATYIAGAGGVNMQGLRSASAPVVSNGFVFVASSAGAIACVSAHDGHIRWLRRFLVPVRTGRYAVEPWEMGGPALVGEWLFAVTPTQDAVVQMHRASGRVEATMPTGTTSAWGTPRYLLADEGFELMPPRVFSVGGDIVAFDPDRPTVPLWTLSTANEDLFRERSGVASRSGIRGRVQLAGSTLVVPGLRDVLLVARETGRVRERIEIDGPANPVLVGPQLFLGQNTLVTAMMPAESAERLMRERIEREPLDPEGGLALLDLGLRSKRLELCVEAAASARRAIDAATEGGAGSVANDRAREELVVRLLRAARLDPRPESLGAAESLFTMLKDIARTPSQSVRFLLAWGDWLAARERWPEAVAAIDRVLADPVLANEPHIREDDREIIAEIEAIERLQRWERSAAEEIRGRSAAVAERLASLDLQDGEALARLALSAPLTAASIDAAVAAAGRLADASRFRESWVTLQRVLRTVPRDGAHRDQRASLVSAAIDVARRAGWSESERSLVDLIRSESGDLDLIVGGEPTTLAAVAAQHAVPAPSLGGEPGVLRDLPGRLVQSVDPELVRRLASRGATDRGILLAEGRSLAFHRLPDLGRVWTAPLADADPVLLGLGAPRVGDAGAAEISPSDEAMLLWQALSEREATIRWIRRSDGETLAATPELGAFFPAEALLEGGRPVNQQMPNESPFIPSQLLPVTTAREVVVIRRNGDIVAFDKDDLSKPLWRQSRVLDQVYEIGWTDWGIALAGRTAPAPGEILRPDANSGQPALVVLDPSTGRVLTSTELDESEDAIWLRLFETGEAIIGTELGLLAFDVGGRIGAGTDASGDRASVSPASLRWRIEAVEAHASAGAWRIGGTLLVAIATELSEAILPIDIASAQIVEERFRALPRLDNRRLELRSGGRVGDLAVLQYRDRIIAFDLHGELVGEDGIADEDRDFATVLPAEDTILVVSNAVPRQILMADGSGLRFEYSYVLYRLSASEGCRLLGPGIRVRTIGQRAQRWSVVDGFVIVSTNGGSMAVPLPSAAVDTE
jgi:hypothetical protein